MARVLVIDDMQSNAELMVAHLRDAGYDVITANDGAGGIKKAKLFMPDIIVLDLVMPKMSGFDVCRTLKRDPETKDIIILTITAMSSRETRIRAFEAGADEYLEKTFDKGIFLAKIKSLLRVKSLSDELKDNYAMREEQNRQFEMQLEMAQHIQQALISEMSFSLNDVSFASCYRPAHSVGGDLYDVVTLGADSIAVFMADVSGHGVSAALLTSMLKIMFRNLVEAHTETDKLLHQMNEEFCGIFEGSSVNIYACAFFALINMSTKEVHYSSAGGAPTLYFNKALNTVTELQLGGKPLGMMNDSVYQTGMIHYGGGDIFLFQTDGLCDSLYKNEPEQFIAKISELLIDEADSTPDEIIAEVLNEFFDAGEGTKTEKDDVSIIICKMEQMLERDA